MVETTCADSCEVSFMLHLPQDCYENRKDIEDLLLVTKGLRDEDKVVELINKACRIDQRMLWMTDYQTKRSSRKYQVCAAIVNKRLKKEIV
jgi:predicted CoA-binding protein